jgi:hypothetical protein
MSSKRAQEHGGADLIGKLRTGSSRYFRAHSAWPAIERLMPPVFAAALSDHANLSHLISRALQISLGDAEVYVVVMLEGGTEVEVRLPDHFKVSPQIAGAIKAVPGVVAVEAAWIGAASFL